MSSDAEGDQDTDIRELDQATVERIAAGEVVERPASVVKELVENSLDAGAERIEIAVDGDGTELIRVRDDGHGMTEADVRAAVREHTTSKIADIEDLETGVSTLGFRGEALHTIGAVSRVTITTKPRGTEGAGTELVYEGGEMVSVEPVGCPEGTTVEVEDLFYNTPARAKFLKTEATEFAHVNRIASRYALANPDVAVSLDHDGRETFATAGQGSLQATILEIYGRDVAEGMRPFVAGDPPPSATDLDGGDVVDLSDSPIGRIGGYISDPETTRSSNDYVTTFVNGRYVDAPVLRDAVLGAYGDQLASNRYPFAVLFVAVPPDSIDVNVHPRKRTIRFDDENAIRSITREAVRTALLEEGLVRTGAPRGRSAPEETAVETPAPGDGPEQRSEPATDTEADPSPAAPSSQGAASAGGKPGETDEPGETTSRPDGDRESTHSAARTGRSRSSTTSTPARPGKGQETLDTGESGPEPEAYTEEQAITSMIGDPEKFEVSTGQETLAGDTTTIEEYVDHDHLPAMRVLGQLDETYIVAESEAGLVLIDQHAADERVTYEQLQDQLGEEPPVQRLATPVKLSLTAGEQATFEAAQESLASLGFRASLVDGDDDDDGHTLTVEGVPAIMGETADPDRIRDLLDAFVGGDPSEAFDSMADRFLADLACYPALTGNTSLTEGAVTDLLAALDDCENPFACPHGRPVVVQVPLDEIEARFERDYPGHGGGH